MVQNAHITQLHSTILYCRSFSGHCDEICVDIQILTIDSRKHFGGPANRGISSDRYQLGGELLIVQNAHKTQLHSTILYCRSFSGHCDEICVDIQILTIDSRKHFGGPANRGISSDRYQLGGELLIVQNAHKTQLHSTILYCRSFSGHCDEICVDIQIPTIDSRKHFGGSANRGSRSDRFQLGGELLIVQNAHITQLHSSILYC